MVLDAEKETAAEKKKSKQAFVRSHSSILQFSTLAKFAESLSVDRLPSHAVGENQLVLLVLAHFFFSGWVDGPAQ